MAYGSAMRILVCPDSFGGTLSASAAADAIIAGWSSARGDTEFVSVPLSDGGPGFIETMQSALGGKLCRATLSGAFGEEREVFWLRCGNQAYVEVAQVCGIEDSKRDEAAAMSASSFGVGQLLLDISQDASIAKISLGLGGTSISDAGVGLLAALGASANVDLTKGVQELNGLEYFEWNQALDTLGNLKIEFLTDVDVPLTGKRGAGLGFSVQKGATPEGAKTIDELHSKLAEKLGRSTDGKNHAVTLGAGAAGGIGYALLWLGGERVPGISRVIEETQLLEIAKSVDLVISGEGKLDWQSEVGKVMTGVADLARTTGLPLLALVGQNELSLRECQSLGVHGVYSMAEYFGLETSMAQPAETLYKLAARAARTWG
jgi:glycerate 2-kinase